MESIIQDFVEIRASGTPWVLVVTPDVESTVKMLAAAASVLEAQSGVKTAAQVSWNLAGGALVLSGEQTFQDSVNKPFPLLQAAQNMIPTGVLFVEVPGPDFWRSDIVVSAIANLRDPFKESSRTLVFVAKPGAGDVLPLRISDDVPVLRVSLPDEVELRKMVDAVVSGNEITVDEATRTRAVSNVRGMTLFAAEGAVARKCLMGSLDVDSLSEVRREGIESATGSALVFEQETLTFDDVGGMGALKSYMELLFKGRALLAP